MEKKFWQSTNFLTFFVTLFVSAFIGFDGTEAIVGQIILGFASLRNLLKDGKFDWKKWVSDSNFWMYLGAILSLALPGIIDPQVLEHLEDIVLELINWNDSSLQRVLLAFFSLVSFLLKKFGIVKSGFTKLFNPTVQ